MAALALSITALGVAPAQAAGTPVQTLIANDTLYIGATDAKDLMLLRQNDPGRVTLDMGADGIVEGSFFTTQFHHIDIALEGGDDRLLLTDVEVDVDARGGAGNDDLNGGRGADVLDGRDRTRQPRASGAASGHVAGWLGPRRGHASTSPPARGDHDRRRRRPRSTSWSRTATTVAETIKVLAGAQARTTQASYNGSGPAAT